MVRITCFPSAESKAGARAKDEASPRSYLYPETPIVADVCRNLILAFPPGGGEALRASSDVALFCRANRCASESPPVKPAEYGGIGGSAAEKLPTSLLGGGGSPSFIEFDIEWPRTRRGAGLAGAFESAAHAERGQQAEARKVIAVVLETLATMALVVFVAVVTFSLPRAVLVNSRSYVNFKRKEPR